ncbi:MAG: radical SAM family heme chaperone HemW [Planctomycetes bacterium]|nr:radical SAM family heme chaperone HemW [Planctomycetota bacterium]
MASLYIHVPFCVRKCGYCDFYSGVAGDADIERYIAALDREFALRAPTGLAPETIFIGGGTPTRLSAPQLGALGAILKRYVDLRACTEFTCEINPGTLTPQKADALVAMGVNRASFGVQSFEPKYLQGLDRAHEAGVAPRALEIARAAGISRLNMDLMFAMPGQTLAEFESDIRQALNLGTQHISMYALTFEDDTPLTRQLKQGTIAEAPPELEEAMFQLAGRVAGEAGLARYEVSNFARPGAECAHNLVYWTCGDWHGFGAGAHGMTGGVVTRNVADFAAYERCLSEGNVPHVPDAPMAPAERAETLLLMGLRLTRGVELQRFRQFTGVDFHVACGEPAGRLIELGLLELTPAHVRATPRGMLVLDSVILELAMALGYSV